MDMVQNIFYEAWNIILLPDHMVFCLYYIAVPYAFSPQRYLVPSGACAH